MSMKSSTKSAVCFTCVSRAKKEGGSPHALWTIVFNYQNVEMIDMLGPSPHLDEKTNQIESTRKKLKWIKRKKRNGLFQFHAFPVPPIFNKIGFLIRFGWQMANWRAQHKFNDVKKTRMHPRLVWSNKQISRLFFSSMKSTDPKRITFSF